MPLSAIAESYRGSFGSTGHIWFARRKAHTIYVRYKDIAKGDGCQIRVRERENRPGRLVWRCY